MSTQTRDRISEIAREKDLTANNVIEFLLEEYLWSNRMRLVKTQMASTSEEDMRAYRAETALWDTASADGLED